MNVRLTLFFKNYARCPMLKNTHTNSTITTIRVYVVIRCHNVFLYQNLYCFGISLEEREKSIHFNWDPSIFVENIQEKIPNSFKSTRAL